MWVRNWLAQAAEERTLLEAFIGRFGLLLGVVAVGLAFAGGLLLLLRRRQTEPGEMSGRERWLLLVLIALVAGLALVGVVRAVV